MRTRLDLISHMPVAVPFRHQIGVINIDAHLDVRPLKNGQVHSGSPFRLLLQDPRFAKHLGEDSRPRFVEFAAQGSQCSQEHVNWLKENGRESTEIVWLSQLRSDGIPSVAPSAKNKSVREIFEATLNNMAGEALFVSFDLDAVTGADAPGVSCPGTIGLTAQEAIAMCFVAGSNPRVKLFDLSEFNPKVDEYRTGRLVANMFYSFCLGVTTRVAPEKK